MGRMNCLNGTRSVKRSSAMSLSTTLKIDRLEILRPTLRVSSEGPELQVSWSPNVTFTINHILFENLTKEINKSMKRSKILNA